MCALFLGWGGGGVHKEHTRKGCQCSRKGLLLRPKHAGFRRGRIKRPFNKISLMCNTDPSVPNRIHLAETEMAHTPLVWCAETEKTSRTESLAQNFCRKKQIPIDGYSCSLHKWSVYHRTHSSAHLLLLSAHLRTSACSFPRSNHSQSHGQLNSRLSSSRNLLLGSRTGF